MPQLYHPMKQIKQQQPKWIECLDLYSVDLESELVRCKLVLIQNELWMQQWHHKHTAKIVGLKSSLLCCLNSWTIVQYILNFPLKIQFEFKIWILAHRLKQSYIIHIWHIELSFMKKWALLQFKHFSMCRKILAISILTFLKVIRQEMTLEEIQLKWSSYYEKTMESNYFYNYKADTGLSFEVRNINCPSNSHS